MSNPQQLVQKLWKYRNILRDDDLSYGDYVEQLTFLLFLKMADKQAKSPFDRPSVGTDRVVYVLTQTSRCGAVRATGLAQGIFGPIWHSVRWTAFV